MEIHSPIYGSVSLTEQVLVDLIASPPLQRLQGISQYSLPPEFYHRPGFTRYTHSLGVLLLLQKLQAPLEEQVAGLLHDVSHTAFSHLMDRIMNTMDDDSFQNSIHEQFIRNSIIPTILQDYGFSVDRIINLEHFPLLERDIPQLCADRVDYGLQEFQAWANPAIVKQCVADVCNYNHEIVFKTYDSARKFAVNFAKCDRENWAGKETTIRSTLFANGLQYAMGKGIITQEDFLTGNDSSIMEKLRASKDAKLEQLFSLLTEEFQWRVDVEKPQFSERKKLRYVDPKFMEEGTLQQLSTVDPVYCTFVEELKRENKEGVKLRLLWPDGQDYSHC